MKKGKKIVGPKAKFLHLVETTNRFLHDEVQLSKEDALAKFNQEIAPYGYPNYQKSLVHRAIKVWDYNSCQIHKVFKGLMPDILQEDGTVNSFSNMAMNLKDELSGSNFYITDELATSLFNTDTPDDYNFIKEALSLNILPQINIVFSNDFKLNDKSWWDSNDLHTIQVRYLENRGVDVYVYLLKHTGAICHSFTIPLIKNDCCQLCETQKFFDENHRGEFNYMVNASKFFNPEDHTNHEYSKKYLEERKEFTEELVDVFRKQSLPNIYTFVINLLCLMTQQPDIISVEKSASKYVATTNKGFASKKMNNVPNVHWLGADFTTRVQYSKKINTDPSDITRGKPKRSHWRRGHWHTISQGPGRLQKKLRWFEPVFIKGHKQEVK
jgi:hypothetical protein